MGDLRIDLGMSMGLFKFSNIQTAFWCAGRGGDTSLWGRKDPSIRQKYADLNCLLVMLCLVSVYRIRFRLDSLDSNVILSGLI